MAGIIKISDDLLETAGASLISASLALVERTPSVPWGGVPSLMNIEPAVERFLVGVHTGCVALADAAKTASSEVAALMEESTALDTRIASSLSDGFALQGPRL